MFLHVDGSVFNKFEEWNIRAILMGNETYIHMIDSSQYLQKCILLKLYIDLIFTNMNLPFDSTSPWT